MAIKRASSSGASSAKRRSTSGKANVAKQCSLVQTAVRSAADYPDSVRKMVAANVSCLSVPKEDRHQFQQQSITMIGEILGAEETRRNAAVQAIEAKLSTAGDEKAQRDQAHDAAASALSSQNEATNGAKAALAESVAAAKAAKASLAAAEAAQKDGDVKATSDAERKERLTSALNEALAALEDGSAVGSVARSKAAAVTKAAKECKLDPALLSSLGATLGKAAADRGTYDALVMRQLKSELKTHVSSAEAAVAASEASKPELASAVEVAKANLAQAQEKEAASKAAAEQSKQELDRAKAAEKETAQAVSQFAGEFKQVEKDLASAKAALSDLVGGALAAYKDLLEHTAIKPVEVEATPVGEAAAAA